MFNYIFSIPPALHASDLPWTFYDGESPDVDDSIATTFQKYLLNFVWKGNPKGPDLPSFEEYGMENVGWTLIVTNQGLQHTRSLGANARCRCCRRGSMRVEGICQESGRTHASSTFTRPLVD